MQTTPTLSQIRRAMNEDPRELRNSKSLDWAIELVSHRLSLIPEGPARQRYAERLQVLTFVKEAS
jgi:antitoxin component HigA of HigAB toxin-antitoxin module